MKLIFATDAVFHPLTGIGRYAYELAQRLPHSPKIESIKYFNGLRFASALEHGPPARSAFNRSLRAWALRNPMAVQAYRTLTPWLRWGMLRRFSDHVYHSPNYFLPPFAGPCVVTFHDLSHVRWPQCHPPERIRFMDKEIPLTLRRADLIIADSEFTRREILEYYGLPPAKVVAVHLAAGPEFTPRSEAQVGPALAELGLRYRGYALYVGTIEPRKNLAGLLDAFSGLSPSLRRRFPLVLAGDRGWRSMAVHRRIEAAQREGWVRYLGYVPQEVLPCLYAGARIFAYPSLYEGFGLPVLEAMACGAPVVCSNAASLPEVTGGLALMSDPMDVDRLRENLQRALEDEVWWDQASTQGLVRASEFSWERTAAETVAAYQLVA